MWKWAEGIWAEGTGTRMCHWVLFGVSFALLPFLLNALVMWGNSSAPKSLSDLWPRGELLLVSSAIAADAAGELMGHGGTFPLLRKIAGWGCMVVLFLTASWFAILQLRVGKDVMAINPDPNKISTGSIVFFMINFITSGCCKLLAELRPPKGSTIIISVAREVVR